MPAMTTHPGRALRAVMVLAALTTLAACALPRGSGVEREVLRGATAEESEFAVYPVTRDFVPVIAGWPVIGEAHLEWITTSRGSRGRIIQPGDTLSVTIWDSSVNSLLTNADARQAVMPPMRVSAGGSIFVPYVGDLRVSGLSPSGARARIQSRLSTIAPDAQVQLALREGRMNSVDLVGGVSQPGVIPLPDLDFTVLSLIAVAGGVDSSLENPQVRLRRGGKLYGTSIARLYEEPALDTRLAGGDQIVVQEEDRYFTSLGAAETEKIHLFPKDIVLLSDALAMISGLDASRANPQGVLILRQYPAEAVVPVAGDLISNAGPEEASVVFTLDMTGADGLFASRNMRIMSGDIIYVSESPIVSTRTLFGILGTAFGLAAAASGD
jgi:polysaccharide export outer membrane protein